VNGATHASSGMGKVTNDYIASAIDELIAMLGVKEDIPMEVIRKPLDRGNIEASIENIASYLGLPVAVNLSYVSGTYRRGNSGDSFDTDALATTDSAGRGREGITAQVSIPDYLPPYGTSGLRGFPIAVKISKNCSKHPETFLAIMAHELSHILLHSLRHTKGDNEIYTDLTAMILGFSNVMRIGRKVTETRDNIVSTEILTTTYGYLPDEQFNFAFSRITNILNKIFQSKKLLLQGLTTYKKQLSSYKAQFSRLNKLVEYLDRRHGSKFNRADTSRIIQVHQPSYIDELRTVIRSNEKSLKGIDDCPVGLIHYTQQVSNSLAESNERLENLITDLMTQLDLLNSDVKILKKYVGLPHKIKWALFAR